DGDHPPNNWLSSFGGPAWSRDERSGRWYLHNFAPEQPDLDWWNEAVRDEVDEILRFWFARGVAGFRIGVCHGIVKDAGLRDHPGGPPLGAAARLQAGVLVQPPGGARRAAPLARRGRCGGPRADPGGRDVRARRRPARALLRRRRGRAAPGVQLPAGPRGS